MWKKCLSGMLLLALSIPGMAQDNEADISFRGTLQEPPSCTLNSGSVIDVDFGDSVGVESVDGVSHRVPLNYSITCTGSSVNAGTLTLTLMGMVTSFDAEALQTSVGDLGIRVYQGSGNVPLTPDVGVAITLNSPPSLEAVLVKKSGSTLGEGAFEAIATLKAEYL